MSKPVSGSRAALGGSGEAQWDGSSLLLFQDPGKLMAEPPHEASLPGDLDMWWTRTHGVVATGSVRVRKAVRVARELETLESRVLLTGTLIAPAPHVSTVQHNDVVAPAAPTSAVATAVSTTGIRLTWTDNATDETGFEILRRMGASGSFTKIATVGANAKAYNDSKLSAGTVYSYEVLAVNGSASSSASNIATTKTLALPTAPGNLTAATLSPNSVQLKWADRSTNERGFEILSHIGSSKAWTVIGNVLANVTSFVAPSLIPNTPYTFEVMAVGVGGMSSASNTASATTTTLGATVLSPTSAQLTWTTAASSVTGFDIQRQVVGTNTWTTVKSVTKTSSQRAHATGGLPFSFIDSSLTPGVRYNYRVVAKSGTKQSAVSNAALVATPASLTLPSNLVAAPTSATNIQLTWTDDGNDATGFQVFRDADNSGNFTFLTTTTSPSYTDFGLQPGVSYSYEVLAINGTTTSTSSNQASAMTLPSAPSALSAVSLTANSIQLSWIAGAGTVTGYTVQRQGGDGQWMTVATVDANTTTFTDANLPANAAYSYQVIATNNGQASAASNPASAQTLMMAPGSLTITAVSINSVQLSWSADPSATTGYQIIRQDPGTGDWTVLTNVSPDNTSFTDTGLDAAQEYSYEVVAINGVTTSTPSNQVTATTLSAAPTNLTAMPLTANTVQLNWAYNSPNETGFQIQRQDPNTATWSVVGSVGQGVTTYTDTNLSGGSQYSYEVVALNGVTTSTPSNQVAAMTLPVAPSNLTATPLTANSIQLSWTDSSSNETGFQIQRQDPSTGTWSVVGSVGQGVTTYTDTNLAGSNQYSYEVVALNGVTTSAPSNMSSSTTLQAPAAASSLTDVVQISSQVTLTWSDNSNGQAGFKVARSLDGVHFTTIGSVVAGTTTYTDMNLNGSTTYYYLVVATNSVGDGAPSNMVSVTPQNAIVYTLNGNGFTTFTPSSDTQIISVSSSQGINSNTGSSPTTPVQTIAYAESLITVGHPVWLLLKSGDTWNESIGQWKWPGDSPNAPSLVSSYGTGALPLLKTGTDSGIMLTGGGGSSRDTEQRRRHEH